MLLPRPNLLLGTSSFSSKDWIGPFYPPGTSDKEMLTHYATRFPTVEIDATFYGIPAEKTVCNWRDRTPPGFEIATKLPQAITHEKFMVDCQEDLSRFLTAVDHLQDRLGPILIQFPYFKKGEVTLEQFMTRLVAFLPLLPKDHRFALEVRNKTFVTEAFLDTLRQHQVAFALIDHPYMDRPTKLMAKHNVVTAKFAYVRWLGDRYKIEAVTKSWGKVVHEKGSEMSEWAQVVEKLLDLELKVYAYANNHYEGHAPSTLASFAALLEHGHRTGNSGIPF